jgi:hypothetical protein
MADAATSGRRRGSSLGEGPPLLFDLRARGWGREDEEEWGRRSQCAFWGLPSCSPPCDHTRSRVTLTRIFKRAEVRRLRWMTGRVGQATRWAPLQPSWSADTIFSIVVYPFFIFVLWNLLLKHIQLWGNCMRRLIIQNFRSRNSVFQKYYSNLYLKLIITDISGTRSFGFTYWITHFIHYVPVS